MSLISIVAPLLESFSINLKTKYVPINPKTIIIKHKTDIPNLLKKHIMAGLLNPLQFKYIRLF